MNYMNLKTDICLTDAEQMCKHQVVSLLNISGLMKWDILGVSLCDGYPKDLYTERTSEDCPACNFYLSTFLKSTMRRISWKTEMLSYFCTGCKLVKNFPPKGSKCLDLTRCKSCKTLVIDALSDTWTFLASWMAKTITEGSTPVDGWTLHSASSRRASISWIQGLAERVNCAWELGLMQDSGHLPVLTWSAALKEVSQEAIIQMRPLAVSCLVLDGNSATVAHA